MAAGAALSNEEIARLLESTCALIEAEMNALGDDGCRFHFKDGEWCVNEVMGHLLHVETAVFLPRLRRMRDEEVPSFEAFTPEPWARERDHSVDPFEASLAGFERVRRETLTLLDTLPPGAAERPGVSRHFGPMTLAQYATHVADHDLEHLAQLADCRRAATA